MADYTGFTIYPNRELFYTDDPFESTGIIEANVNDANYIPKEDIGLCNGVVTYYPHTLYEVVGGVAGGVVLNNGITIYSTAPVTDDINQGQIVYDDINGAFPFNGQNWYHFGNALDYQDIHGDYMQINAEGRVIDLTQ